MSSDQFGSQVEDVLRGSYDLHVHAGPDPHQDRRGDALETARWAQEAEMGGFVLKSHEYSTAPLARTVSRVYPGLDVVGSIVLNREVGGLNAYAVEAAALLGARVVWMPTFSADFFFPRLRRHPHVSSQYKDRLTATPGIRLTDDNDKLLPEVAEVLDVVLAEDMVLASGHASPAETLTLFREAKTRGIGRMIATHPHALATMDEQREMVSLGALIEQTFISCMPAGGRSSGALVAAVRDLGFEHCVVSTDFGQRANPPPAEGMRMAIATLLEEGLTPFEASVLTKENPRQLVAAGG